MTPVVVFDTNILVSAIGWGGVPGRCVELAQARAIDAVTCVEILDELADILDRKLHFNEDQIQQTIASLALFLRLVSITGKLSLVEGDADDNHIAECAIVARADYIVTGDKRHMLPLGKVAETRIVTAAELLKAVQVS